MSSFLSIPSHNIGDALSLCAYPPITDKCMRELLGLGDADETTTFGPRRLDDVTWETEATTASTSSAPNSTVADVTTTTTGRRRRIPARETTPRPLAISSSSSLSLSITPSPSFSSSIISLHPTLPLPRLPLFPPSSSSSNVSVSIVGKWRLNCSVFHD